MVKEGLTVCFPPLANEKEIKLLALGNTLALSGQERLCDQSGTVVFRRQLFLVPCTRLNNPDYQHIGLSNNKSVSLSIHVTLLFFVVVVVVYEYILFHCLRPNAVLLLPLRTLTRLGKGFISCVRRK